MTRAFPYHGIKNLLAMWILIQPRECRWKHTSRNPMLDTGYYKKWAGLLVKA
jgi:hypothetical protein